MHHSQRDSLLREVLEDLPISALAGLAGTKAMEPVGQKLYEWESEEGRSREEAVRPGPPFEIAAAKALRLLGPRFRREDDGAAGACLSLRARARLVADLRAAAPADDAAAVHGRARV